MAEPAGKNCPRCGDLPPGLKCLGCCMQDAAQRLGGGW